MKRRLKPDSSPSSGKCSRDFTIFTVPQRFAELGDLHGDIDDGGGTGAFDVAPLLEWAARDEAEGAEPPAEPED